MALIKSIKNSYYLQSGIYSLGQRFSSLFFGFGSFYFLVRLYNTDQHGTWVIYFTTATIVEMSRNGLIQNALIKFLSSAEHSERPKIQVASLALNLFFSLLTFGLLLLASFWFLNSSYATLSKMFVVYGINLILMVPFSHFVFIQMFNLNFKGIFYGALIRQGLFFVCVAYLYYDKQVVSLPYLVVIQAVSIFLSIAVLFFFAREYILFSKRLTLEWIRKLFQYGKYVMGTNISSMIFKTTDQYMLAALVSTGSTSIYNAALRVSNLVEYPSTSIADVIFPKSVREIREKGLTAAKRLYEKSVGLILAIVLPIIVLVWFNSDIVMLLIAGADYKESGAILSIIILFGFITPFNRQFGTIMDAIGKPELNFRLLASTTVINIFANFVFITIYGTIGAAYGTLLSYSINLIINQYLLQSILSVSFLSPFTYMIGFYKTALFGIVRTLNRFGK